MCWGTGKSDLTIHLEMWDLIKLYTLPQKTCIPVQSNWNRHQDRACFLERKTPASQVKVSKKHRRLSASSALMYGCNEKLTNFPTNPDVSCTLYMFMFMKTFTCGCTCTCWNVSPYIFPQWHLGMEQGPGQSPVGTWSENHCGINEKWYHSTKIQVFKRIQCTDAGVFNRWWHNDFLTPFPTQSLLHNLM